MKFGRLLVALTVAAIVADGQPATAPRPPTSQIAPPNVQSNAVPAQDTQRRIDLSLKNNVLKTNFVIATVSAGKDRPVAIAVVVKPALPPAPDDPARLPKHSSAHIQRYMQTHEKEIRERLAQETVDWSKANWLPFTANITNVAVDFGPGEGKRVLWWAARWSDGSQITAQRPRSRGPHASRDHHHQPDHPRDLASDDPVAGL
jgi:hypothetical protein